jgi:hypothetical protein
MKLREVFETDARCHLVVDDAVNHRCHDAQRNNFEKFHSQV